jgi:hypothetical protein
VVNERYVSVTVNMRVDDTKSLEESEKGKPPERVGRKATGLSFV